MLKVNTWDEISGDTVDIEIDADPDDSAEKINAAVEIATTGEEFGDWTPVEDSTIREGGLVTRHIKCRDSRGHTSTIEFEVAKNRTWHVTVRGFGRVSSFFVQAETAAQAERKALLSCNVSVEVQDKGEERK